MKTLKVIFTITLFVFLFTVLNAQVTFEKKYDFSTAVVELETLGYKYFLMDVPNGQCRIYNMDCLSLKKVDS